MLCKILKGQRMKKEEPPIVLIYPFYSTLDTAMRLTLTAQNIESKDTKNILAKSAIIHCALAIEALANSLIANLNLQSKFEESIEKLDTISKLQMFYMVWKSSPNMDRGQKCIQIFQEFISIRNTYVHPKSYSVKAEKTEDGNYTIPIKDHYKILNIKKDNNVWSGEDAVLCLNHLLKALDWFIIDSLGLCNKRVEDIIFFNIKKKDGNGLIIPPKPYPWDKPEYKDFYQPEFLLSPPPFSTEHQKE
jgi:hypothetical protein